MLWNLLQEEEEEEEEFVEVRAEEEAQSAGRDVEAESAEVRRLRGQIAAWELRGLIAEANLERSMVSGDIGGDRCAVSNGAAAQGMELSGAFRAASSTRQAPV